MNDIHKSLLQEMMHPPLRSRKTRMIGFLIALPLGFFWMLHTDLPLWITIAVTALLAVLIPASFIWEIRSEKKNADFREAIKNGSYFEDEAWREKYRKYCETHDFSRVTAKTMRSDLHRHFLKPSGFVLIAVSLGFFIPAALWESGDIAVNVILALAGLGFLLWGIAKLRCVPVRQFLRKYEAELPHIERSYLNGKVLTFRSTGVTAENNGINIGGNYTVMWYLTGICAIDNKRITKVTRRVVRTNYYNDGVFCGTGTKFLLQVDYLAADGESRWCRIRLNEFQAEMAYDALTPIREAAEYKENIHHEIG